MSIIAHERYGFRSAYYNLNFITCLYTYVCTYVLTYPIFFAFIRYDICVDMYLRYTYIHTYELDVCEMKISILQLLLKVTNIFRTNRNSLNTIT